MDGRFISRDTWGGSYNSPQSLNRWNYTQSNPINYTDPTGLIAQSDSTRADEIVNELKIYRVFVKVDWGSYNYWHNDPVDSSKSSIKCGWIEGNWNLNELIEIRKGIVDTSRAMKGLNSFIFNYKFIQVYRKVDSDPNVKARGGLQEFIVNDTRHDVDRWTTTHELGHIWDANNNWQLSAKLVDFTKQFGKDWGTPACDKDKKLPGCNAAGYVYYDVLAHGSGSTMNSKEDFANSFAGYVYPIDTQGRIQKYLGTQYEKYLYYTDYTTTLRWKYVDALVQTTNLYARQ